MTEHLGKNEEIRVLEDFVCQAIPDPSLAPERKNGSDEVRNDNESQEGVKKKSTEQQ
jgi:hypothetical protein